MSEKKRGEGGGKRLSQRKEGKYQEPLAISYAGRIEEKRGGEKGQSPHGGEKGGGTVPTRFPLFYGRGAFSEREGKRKRETAENFS